MTEIKVFGGLGGITGGRELNPADDFEVAVKKALGEQVLNDDELASKLWASLVNQGWKHTDGHTAGYSFRAAGDLVAAIRGSGDYMDWYCSHHYPYRGKDITEPMRAHGWSISEDTQ